MRAWTPHPRPIKGETMVIQSEESDLQRLADDGCPNVGPMEVPRMFGIWLYWPGGGCWAEHATVPEGSNPVMLFKTYKEALVELWNGGWRRLPRVRARVRPLWCD